jgi:hypothetical protein
MKALIALTGAVIAVVGTVAYAAPVAAQPGTVRVTFAEWCATRPLGGIDVEHAARDGIRLAPATRGSSVTRAQALAAAQARSQGWLPGQPVSSGLYDVDVETSDVDGVGWTRGTWVVSFPRRPSASGQAPTSPCPRRRSCSSTDAPVPGSWRTSANRHADRPAALTISVR